MIWPAFLRARSMFRLKAKIEIGISSPRTDITIGDNGVVSGVCDSAAFVLILAGFCQQAHLHSLCLGKGSWRNRLRSLKYRFLYRLTVCLRWRKRRCHCRRVIGTIGRKAMASRQNTVLGGDHCILQCRASYCWSRHTFDTG